MAGKPAGSGQAAAKKETPAMTGGRPSEDQINAWKQKHGAVHQLTADGYLLIIREPLTKDLERAFAADPKKNKAFNFNRSIIENCKLYEDAGARDDDRRLKKYFFAIDSIVDMEEAEVKKL